MSLLDRITAPAQIAETLESISEAQIVEMAAELANAEFKVEELQESLADVELMLEDRGWMRLGAWAEQQFTRNGIERAARVCRAMVVANPLLRRGLSLRSTYIWSGGVTIQAKAKGGDDGKQDVNAVLQDFLDDRATRKHLTGAEAQQTNERTLGTDGNLFAALFTAPRTGRVQPRLLALEEIHQVVKNPDDRSEAWFYQRISIDPDTGGQRVSYHPDIDYQPAQRVLRFGDGARIGTVDLMPGEVMWDAPIIHLKVNALQTWDFGIGDAFTAVGFARMYQEFLVDWAKLVKALSRFAWRLSSARKGAADKAVQRINARVPVPGEAGAHGAGQTAGMLSGTTLEAIPKTGATIDSGSGRPLAAMVAAALDVPVTMLLADPGVTGARATAETLDTPTEGMASQRQQLWGEFYRRLLDYVIDAAVRAPQGALAGTVSRDEWGRLDVVLDGDTERTIQIDWPDLSDTPIDLLMAAIKDADDIDKLPPLLIVQLMLAAFNVEDADEWLSQVTDENGEFVNPNPKPDPAPAAGTDAVNAFNRGEDPAALLGNG